MKEQVILVESEEEKGRKLGNLGIVKRNGLVMIFLDIHRQDGERVCVCVQVV